MKTVNLLALEDHLDQEPSECQPHHREPHNGNCDQSHKTELLLRRWRRNAQVDDTDAIYESVSDPVRDAAGLRNWFHVYDRDCSRIVFAYSLAIKNSIHIGKRKKERELQESKRLPCVALHLEINSRQRIRLLSLVKVFLRIDFFIVVFTIPQGHRVYH
jgi:hypothetical protein